MVYQISCNEAIIQCSPGGDMQRVTLGPALGEVVGVAATGVPVYM